MANITLTPYEALASLFERALEKKHTKSPETLYAATKDATCRPGDINEKHLARAGDSTMQKSIPLEALALLSEETPEKNPTESTETSSEAEKSTTCFAGTSEKYMGQEDSMVMRLPLAALASLSAEKPVNKPTKSTDKSSETTNPDTNHIADLTDQYTGKSLIITGVKKPQ